MSLEPNKLVFIHVVIQCNVVNEKLHYVYHNNFDDIFFVKLTILRQDFCHFPIYNEDTC